VVRFLAGAADILLFSTVSRPALGPTPVSCLIKIKKNLRHAGYEDEKWIRLAEDRTQQRVF
jgi:hypothetical protein